MATDATKQPTIEELMKRVEALERQYDHIVSVDIAALWKGSYPPELDPRHAPPVPNVQVKLP